MTALAQAPAVGSYEMTVRELVALMMEYQQMINEYVDEDVYATTPAERDNNESIRDQQMIMEDRLAKAGLHLHEDITGRVAVGLPYEKEEEK